MCLKLIIWKFRSVSVEHKNELQMLKVVKVFHNHKRHHSDMTIIVGSDKSTILQAGMLFPQTAPPMIEFSLEIAKRARRSSFFKRQIQAIFKTFGNPGRLVRHQLRLNCTIHPQFGNPVDSFCAINEVSIHRGDYAKAIEFDVLIGSKRLTMSGDGLVVATPFGSTAYTQALGGSILESTLSCFQVLPSIKMATHLSS
jgi:NAD+ kinase